MPTTPPKSMIQNPPGPRQGSTGDEHAPGRVPELSESERQRIREQVSRASGAIWRSWPIRTFAYRNALQGFEHLPFEEAVRQAGKLLGVRGFLPVKGYRDLYRAGRIEEKAIRIALKRVFPSLTMLNFGGREVDPIEVLRSHLLWGIEGLDSSVFEWKVANEEVLTRFRAEVPADKRFPHEEDHLTVLWTHIRKTIQSGKVFSSHPFSPELRRERLLADLAQVGRHQSVAEWIDRVTGSNLTGAINQQMIEWCSVFLDEGLSVFGMPLRDQGFYSAWRELASEDLNAWFLGIRQFPQKIRSLPNAPEDALAGILRRMEIPEADWEHYLRRHLAQLPGWAGFIKWRGGEPDYPMQMKHPIDLVSYLAVRLFYESELVEATCRKKWNIPGGLSDIQTCFRKDPKIDVPPEGWEDPVPKVDPVSGEAWRVFQLAQFLALTTEEAVGSTSKELHSLLSVLDQFPVEAHGPVWLDALEHSYMGKLLPSLSRGSAASSADPSIRPRAQAFFCIDVRSEGFRRHLEHQGSYETFGIAGFFVIPICFSPYGVEEDYLLCPVFIKPKQRVAEVPRTGYRKETLRYETRNRWDHAGHDLYHDLKSNNLSAFPVIDFLAPWFGFRLVFKSLFPGLDRRWKEWLGALRPAKPATELKLNQPKGIEDNSELSRIGFTLEEQSDLVETALRLVGLTQGFARLVFFCAHGGRTENNPYAAAYDCGACGGRRGGPNARALTVMANRPEVRDRLEQRGIKIPSDTFFISGEHNTATDEVELFDQQDLPDSHKKDVTAFLKDLIQAGKLQAQERMARIPGAPKSVSPTAAHRHAKRRSADWAEIRPEWGLSRNAAFIIGPRALSREVNLEGRVFLHSYDSTQDEDGKALETIMTGPFLVVQMISMEYYFSSTDPWSYGSGSKVLHNVTAGVGVMLGRQSDLAAGLPIQSVTHGSMFYHEPMRPLVMIEAPGARVLEIIARHKVLQNLMNHEWVRLVVLDPSEKSTLQYRPGGSLETILFETGEAH